MNLDQAAKKLSKAILDASTSHIDVVPKGWFTMPQLAKQLKKSETTTGDYLKYLVDNGLWERRKYRIQLSERILPVSHYKPK